MIIMMMRSTSVTSQRGVTLMSDLTPPPAPPSCIPIVTTPTALGRLLDEVIDEFRRGVVHLHVEVLDAAGQEVVEPDRRDGDEQTERGLNQRFRDTGRHGTDTTRTRGRDS